MELHDEEEAIGMRKILLHDIRKKKNPQTKGRFLWIFIELCGSKVQLAPLHGNFISVVANPKIVYMLLFFQILCID